MQRRSVVGSRNAYTGIPPLTWYDYSKDAGAISRTTMPLVINNNATATIASTNLSASNTQLERSLNRMASGSKILNPSDDAGGMAVSMKLSAAARRMGSTASNIANTVSFLQTQDGALSVMGKLLNRVSELKTFAVDPTKNASDLANYETEYSALKAEMNALAAETFNGKALFGSTDMDVATTADADGTITMEGVDLLGSGSAGTPEVTTVTGGNTVPFTPSGAGTMVAGAEGLDIWGIDSAPLRLGANQSAVYDGNGKWTESNSTEIGTVSSLSGASSVNLHGVDTISGATATFTPSGGATQLGGVATAGSLAGLELGTITSALQEVATHRAKNGSYQSRLNMAAELLSTNKANMEQANSRIADVDVAEESTKLSRANVIVQAGTSMLTQANNSTQAMRSLLNL